jgi:tRNA(fMet)-specific endonuclease VapC
VFGLDATSTQIFGEAKALLEKRGRRLADADLQIAAISLTLGATIVTGNRRHYERIPGVALENWLRE